MDSLMISPCWKLGISTFGVVSTRRRFGILCGAKKSKSGKTPPEQRNEQNQFPEMPLTELSLGESEGNRLVDASFEQRLEAIRSSGVEKKQLQEEKKYGPIDYNTTDDDKKDNVVVKVVAGLAVLGLVVSFAIGDFLPSASRNVGNEAVTAANKLKPEEEEKFKTEARKFEEVLKTTPNDLPALEGAAVAYAELGEYNKAKDNLEKLTQMTPDNVEALRLLAEVKSAQNDHEGSAAAYRQALKASSSDNMELVLGLTEALIDAKKPGEAVDELLKIKEKLNPSVVQGKTEKSSVSTTTGDDPQDEATEQADNKLDPVQLDLLLGRAYFAWNRAADALAMYDIVIKEHPNDFRGYLAKGVLLKEQDRKIDAERMFIQARFFAPENAKSLVDKYK